MHPKQICADVQSMGSRLVLDEGNLFVENPENIYPEIEELIKSYKPRIIGFLKGEYSKKEHATTQTIEKIINFYTGTEQGINRKINAWLLKDAGSAKDIMTLIEMLSKNGWSVNEPIDNYRDYAIDEISQKLFDKAMAFFKGG